MPSVIVALLAWPWIQYAAITFLLMYAKTRFVLCDRVQEESIGETHAVVLVRFH